MSIAEKIPISLFISFCLSFILISHRLNKKDTDFYSDRRRYTPFFDAWILPLGYLLTACVGMGCYGAKQTVFMLLSISIGAFIQMSVYYLIVYALTPILRKHITPGTCALIWIIPSVLGFVYLSPDFIGGIHRLIIPISEKAAYCIAAVWLLGAVGILSFKIIEHLRFRRRILRCASPITEPDIMLIWNNEIARARMKKVRFEPIVSEAVTAPVSVGLFERTTKVVLPKCSYTESELKLIFRHEIVHICRNDSANKFFMLFCAAICWFNPMIWAGLGKSAEDLELSCDETVLMNADEEKRYEYAELLLANAGNDKGFTSCLSASASSLRYRLSSAVTENKKKHGMLIIFLLFLVLTVSSGYIMPAFGNYKGEAVLFGNSADRCDIVYIKKYSNADEAEYVCNDERALMEYLSNLEMMRVPGIGKYYPESGIMQYAVIIDTAQGEVRAVVSEEYILILINDSANYAEAYYIPDGIDRVYFEGMLTRYTE